MNAEQAFERLRRRMAGLLLTGMMAGCGGGGGGGAASPPADTVYFGSLSDAPAAFVVTGRVSYEDRLYGETAPGSYGFTGATRFKPVRHAIVELVNEWGITLGSTRTDPDGRYTIAATTAGLLHLRVLARTDAATGPRISVKNTDDELYAVTRHFVPAAGTLPLDAEIPISSVAGAYNILDVLTAAEEFVRDRTGAWPPQSLTAVWSPGSSSGTWFQANTIHVLGGSAPGIGDTDEFDDDVLWHEFGHFVEGFSGNADSLGGFHYLNDNTQDMRLAWSEGFASYISGAIKRWLDENHSGVLSDTSDTCADPQLGPLYLDTYDDGERLHWFFAIDYSREPSLDLGSSYSTAETSVAKVLWNIADEFGFARLWQAYRAFPAKPARLRPVSIETYWDNWLAVDPALPAAAYRNRRIDYSSDGFESDDDGTSAPLLTVDHEPSSAESRTLYASGDADFVRVHLIASNRYVMETFGLRNGADTLITIHSAGDTAHPLYRCGTSLAGRCENDNWSLTSYAATGPDPDASHRLMLNDGCKLASRLVFTPDATATYLVRVSSSATPAPGAGRYGAYYLKVSRDPAGYRCH